MPNFESSWVMFKQRNPEVLVEMWLTFLCLSSGSHIHIFPLRKRANTCYWSCPYVALGGKPRADGIVTPACSLVHTLILYLVQPAQLRLVQLPHWKTYHEGQRSTTFAMIQPSNAPQFCSCLEHCHSYLP